MEARARAKFVRMSPRKVRQVVDLIRGKTLEKALALVQLTPRIAGEPVKKLIESAAANAENNHNMSRDDLWVSQAYVDGGPSLRRLRPATMGRGNIIRKRMSHITVVLSDQGGPQVRRPRGAASKPAGRKAAKKGGA